MNGTINERLKDVLHFKRMSSSEFSDAVGISRSTLSAILNSKARPSYEVLEKIGAAFPDINPAWLLLGTNPMLAPSLVSAIATTATPEGAQEAESLRLRIKELERERDMVQAQVDVLKEMMMRSIGQP